MRIKILYVERKFHEFFSLEKVFRQIARSLSNKIFETSFQQTEHLSNLSGMIRNLVWFKAERADIYHITGHINYIALIFPGKKTVLTIHDLTILKTRSGIRRLILKQLLFDLPVRKLEYITAISQTTKDELIAATGCDENKIRVIEIPLDENYAATEKAEFNVVCPQILQIGTAPHKNLVNVVKALAGINCELIIIGKLDEAAADLLKEQKINYRNEFGITDEAVKEFYRTADLVIFCSFYEGFGLPVIEAQAMKTPVITSNINPMAEVAGKGALLVNPHEPLEIRNAVERIIGDQALREDLVQHGIENIKRYNHTAVAEKYANLYREIFEKNQI